MSYTCARFQTLIFIIVSLGIHFNNPPKTYADSDRVKINKAQDLIQKGKVQFRKKRFLQGIEFYKQAHALFPDPKNLYMIAQAYSSLKAKYCSQAIQAWQELLESCRDCKWKSLGIPKQKIQKSRCFVTIQLQGTTPNAHVHYQGKTLGKLPLKKTLAIGEYQNIHIKAQGYWTQVLSLSLQENQQSLDMNIKLIKKESDWLAQNKMWVASTSTTSAVLMLAIGINSFLEAQDYSDQANTLIQNENQRSPELQNQNRTKFTQQHTSLEQKTQSAQNLGILLLGSSAVMASVSVWLWSYKSKVRRPSYKHTSYGDSKTSYSTSEPRIRWAVSPLGAQWSLEF
jgi:tetratricopeptide (TPR) repeat protein